MNDSEFFPRLLPCEHSTFPADFPMKPATVVARTAKTMQKPISLAFILAVLALAGCQTPGGAIISRPPPVIIDPALGDPCIEAAMAKYFIDASRVTLLAANAQGGSTAVVMKADVRDAVCLVSAKGKVISLTDTTPKSANQIAAEEAAAAAKAAGTPAPADAPADAPKPKKKKLVPAVTPAVATTPSTTPPAAPVETPGTPKP